MVDLTGFDASQIEPRQDFSAIPAGDYICVITSSEKKSTKAGDGAYIEIVLQVVGEGRFAGRKLWDRLNMWNANPVAIDIAKQTLSSICRACKVLTPKSTEQLHNIPITVSVRVKEGRNEVAGYKPVGSDGQDGYSEAITNQSPPTIKKEDVPWA